MSKKITFKVSKDGTTITSDAEGFQGGECLRKTEKFMEGLGSTKKQELKPEYYEEAGVDLNQG